MWNYISVPLNQRLILFLLKSSLNLLLCSINLLYVFGYMKRILILFFIFGYSFIISALFEILSTYLNIDPSHCCWEDVQLNIDKVFKPMVLMASTISSRTFYQNFGFRLYFGRLHCHNYFGDWWWIVMRPIVCFAQQWTTRLWLLPQIFENCSIKCLKLI